MFANLHARHVRRRRFEIAPYFGRRLRLARGPIHGVFAATILYLLAKHGPMPTTELHPRVQATHPDLCDDSVDRVINGQRFGKKWKHATRTAQQHLKKQGRIDLVNGKWTLIRSA